MLEIKEKIESIYIKPVETPDPKAKRIAMDTISKDIICLLLDNGLKITDIDKLLINTIQKTDRYKFKIYYMSKLKDNPKCVICGVKKDLELHHIKPISKNPELEYDLNNVTFMCSCCHSLVHHGGSDKTRPDLKSKVKQVFHRELSRKIIAIE